MNMNYSIFDNILIGEYDLILPKYDSIFQLCLKNNISTLGELLRKYENKELQTRNNKTKLQLMGLIGLVKYRYFKEPLHVDEIFFIMIDPVYSKEFTVFKYVIGTKIRENENAHALYSLGLTSDEWYAIRKVVEKEECSMSVIEAILNYKQNPCRKLRKGNELASEVLNKKIDILLDYYKEKFVMNNKENAKVLKKTNEKI